MKKILNVKKDIFLLGIVSFLTDISSEMIFSVFSVFFTTILGATSLLLGIIEGMADFASCSLDYISGFLSDKTGKRKIFTILGYAFSTASKFLLVISSSISLAATFRVVERLGKSFRGPPRDAWISSLAEKSKRGYSFGIHKSLDKAGAIIGPLVAYIIFSYFGQNSETFSLFFKFAIIPAIGALILLFFVKETPTKPQKKENIFKAYKTFGKGFRHYLYSSGIFSLAYFSFGFLLLKAYNVGFSIKDVVFLYVLFNVSFVAVSPFIGKIGDYLGRKKIIALGYIIYFIISLGFIFAQSKMHIIFLFALFGFFYSIDEGQSSAYISDLEKKRRATAIGVYRFFTGLLYLPASVIAGYLWNLNTDYAFIFAAGLSLVALLFFVFKK